MSVISFMILGAYGFMKSFRTALSHFFILLNNVLDWIARSNLGIGWLSLFNHYLNGEWTNKLKEKYYSFVISSNIQHNFNFTEPWNPPNLSDKFFEYMNIILTSF